MKVILSIDPVRYPLTGIGRYTVELAAALSRRSDIEDLRYFAGLEFRSNIPDDTTTAVPGLAARLRPIKTLLARSDRMMDLHQWLSHRRRGRSLRHANGALFHGPNFYLPPFSGPRVVTIHDLSVFKFPHYHPPERVRYMKREIALALKRADVLITVSQAARLELAQYFNWPLDRIVATPLAYAPEFHPRTAKQTTPVLQTLGLQHNSYALFVGTIEPRKNLAGLLTAYSRLPLALRLQVPLVLVGFSGWQNEAIMSQLERAQSEGWAHYLGFAQKADLPTLFAGARAFLFPSHYEGFGLPVLEAMASGVPVVTSNASSLPEVAGGAALLVPPDNIEDLTSAIAKALQDETWRKGAYDIGLANAGLYSWDQCAADTTIAYQKAIVFHA